MHLDSSEPQLSVAKLLQLTVHATHPSPSLLERGAAAFRITPPIAVLLSANQLVGSVPASRLARSDKCHFRALYVMTDNTITRIDTQVLFHENEIINDEVING